MKGKTAEKVLEKFTPSQKIRNIKPPGKLRIELNFLNLLKRIYKMNFIANTIFN